MNIRLINYKATTIKVISINVLKNENSYENMLFFKFIVKILNNI